MVIERLNRVADAEDVLSVAIPVLERDNLELADGRMTSHPWTADAVIEFLSALVRYLKVEHRSMVGYDGIHEDQRRVWLAFDGVRVLAVTAPVGEPARVG